MPNLIQAKATAELAKAKALEAKNVLVELEDDFEESNDDEDDDTTNVETEADLQLDAEGDW